MEIVRSILIGIPLTSSQDVLQRNWFCQRSCRFSNKGYLWKLFFDVKMKKYVGKQGVMKENSLSYETEEERSLTPIIYSGKQK